MARERINENQRFALLIFTIVIGVAVVFVWTSVRAYIARMA